MKIGLNKEGFKKFGFLNFDLYINKVNKLKSYKLKTKTK